MIRPYTRLLRLTLGTALLFGCSAEKAAPGDTQEAGGGGGSPVPDADGDGYGSDDCDDGDPRVHPGADERCNALDDDCDEAVDETPVDGVTWYSDSDEDGYGDNDTAFESCSGAAGQVSTAGDCDDADGTVHPAAVEVCDGVDQDCDEVIDDDPVDGTLYYADSDLDGFSDPSTSKAHCALDEGWTTSAEDPDCDDANRAIHPGAEERCNLVDDDCDGTIDEDGGTLCDLWAEHDLVDADLKITGNETDTNGFPYALDASDANGDGYADYWVSGLYSDLAGVQAGAAFLLEGPLSTSGDLSDRASATLSGPEAGDYAGQRLSTAGDANLDGFDDVWVMVPYDTTSTIGTGSVALTLCPCTGTMSLADADRRWVHEGSNTLGGAKVSGRGDYDGDGVPDAIIGSPKSDSGLGWFSGYAWLVRQEDIEDERGLISSAAITWVADASNEGVGFNVALLGDTTGDGSSDMLVSGWTEDRTTGTGAVWIFEDPLDDGLYIVGDAADTEMLGEAEANYAGSDMCSLGDMNADGYADYAVGAEMQDSAFYGGGAVYVFYGPTAGRSSIVDADAKLMGTAELSSADLPASGGDVDGDGTHDLVVGAYKNGGGPLPGTAYLIRGPVESGAWSLSDADALFVGEGEDHEAGWVVNISGDTNADGYAEVLVGARSYGQYHPAVPDVRGALYLYFGQPF